MAAFAVHIFDADGTRISTANVLLDTLSRADTTPTTQSVSITSADDGFMAVWQSFDVYNSNGFYSVRAQLYSSTGQAIGESVTDFSEETSTESSTDSSSDSAHDVADGESKPLPGGETRQQDPTPDSD